MPTDISVLATVTVGDLSGSFTTMKIDDKTDSSVPYSLIRDGIGPGQMTWRRTTVQSPYLHGRFVVNTVKDTPQVNVNIRVKGTTYAWMAYYTENLLEAFEQRSYQLAITIDGENHTWLCEPADYSVGDAGQFQDLGFRSHQQEVHLVVPRYPIPFAGRY